MLSPDDLKLAQRDCGVPGLAVVLDTEAITNTIRAHLPDEDIRSVEPTYVHYKPHTNCLVAYQLRTSDGEFPIYAKAYGADAGVKLEKTLGLQGIPSSLGPGTLILEATNIGCYFFPVDHRLKGLRRLAYSSTRRNLLRGMLRDPSEISSATLRHLRYKPERRYVACLETESGPKSLLKIFTPARYQAARAAALAFRSQGPLQISRMAGFSDKHNVLAFEWLPGHLLRHTMLSPDVQKKDKTSAVELTGAALAELHSQTPTTLAHQSPAEEIFRLSAQATTIAHLSPAAGKHAEQVVRQIASGLKKIPTETTALHGDFYDHQVLYSDGAPVILDLDEAIFGHPARDLGLFIAHLERDRLHDRLSPDEVDLFADALVQGYQLTRPAPSSRAIRLYTAIGLLRLAAEPFRYREPNWPHQIEALLAHAETMLGRRFPASRP